MSEDTCWCGHHKISHNYVGSGCGFKGCSCNAYRQRIPDTPLDRECMCGHKEHEHMPGCCLKDCACKSFYPKVYTSTSLPSHFLYDDIYYDGNRYIDFKYIVSYEKVENPKDWGCPMITVWLHDGDKITAWQNGDTSYLYHALEKWHKKMGALLNFKYGIVGGMI
jgi:hypothetical protein